jgi:hypothetical protein
MAPETDKDSVLDDIRELCVEFGLPALIMLIAFVLLLTGIDGEVKTILALAAGWLFKSGYTKGKRSK